MNILEENQFQELNHADEIVRRSQHNNLVYVSGYLLKDFEYAYTTSYGTRFYKSEIKSNRRSGYKDIIPVYVSEAKIPKRSTLTETYVKIYGQYLSHNEIGEDQKIHVRLYLSAWEVCVCEDEEDEEYKNMVLLEGTICKQPIYRITPLGRHITDLMLAVNTSDRRSDYIPCIAWEKNALYAGNLEEGDKVKLFGRIQSREL